MADLDVLRPDISEYQEWQAEDAARINRLSDAAAAQGLTVAIEDTPELREDGSLAEDGDEEDSDGISDSSILNHLPGKHSQKSHGRGGGVSVKSRRAKASAVRVAKDVQRYSEGNNEPQLAKMVGGKSLDDNEPADVLTTIGGKAHGIELKTMTVGANRKITMKKSAMDRKRQWERKNEGIMHTVVFDDTQVFNAKGPGQHDLSKRRIFYRRGYGSFRVDRMHEVTGGDSELKQLLGARRNQISVAAGGTKKVTGNVFCPTGKGGGIDPTCSPNKGGSGGGVQFSDNQLGEIAAGLSEMRSTGEVVRDNFLEKLVEGTEYAGRPKIVGNKEIDRLIDQGQPELWRGSSAVADSGMRDGDYFGGTGVYGSGYYFVSGPEAKMAAEAYAVNRGTVSRGALMPGSKIERYTDVAKRAEVESDRLRDVGFANRDMNMIKVSSHWNAGHQAVKEGVDALLMPDQFGGDYYTVVNRSKLALSDPIER